MDSELDRNLAGRRSESRRRELGPELEEEHVRVPVRKDSKVQREEQQQVLREKRVLQLHL